MQKTLLDQRQGIIRRTPTFEAHPSELDRHFRPKCCWQEALLLDDRSSYTCLLSSRWFGFQNIIRIDGVIVALTYAKMSINNNEYQRFVSEMVASDCEPYGKQSPT
jgi:hypothetical protein